MSAPLIQLYSPLQQIENDTPLKPLTHLLRKRTKSPLILVLHQPPLKHLRQLQVLAGKKIMFSFLQTLFLPHTHTDFCTCPHSESVPSKTTVMNDDQKKEFRKMFEDLCNSLRQDLAEESYTQRTQLDLIQSRLLRLSQLL